MEFESVSWQLTILVTHLAAAYAFGMLHESAPCWQQRIVVTFLSVSMLIVACSAAMSINTVEGYLWVRYIGFTIEHIAVLLYACRLIYRERLCLPKQHHGLMPYQRLHPS